MKTQGPRKAGFWCPFLSENAVATFPYLLEMSLIWYPNGLQIGAREYSETRKLVKMRFKNTLQKTSQKTTVLPKGLGLFVAPSTAATDHFNP